MLHVNVLKITTIISGLICAYYSTIMLVVMGLDGTKAPLSQPMGIFLLFDSIAALLLIVLGIFLKQKTKKIIGIITLVIIGLLVIMTIITPLANIFLYIPLIIPVASGLFCVYK